LEREGGTGRDSREQELRVQAGPILREALASAGPGEDVDEALLRALKARYPEQATALLSAVTRMIEVSAARAGEDKRLTMRRLAESEPGPEIVLRSSRGPAPTVVTETKVRRIGDSEFRSLDELPPDMRAAVERSLPAARRERRVGCSVGSVLGCLAALARMFGR
jgi:hypothetical protein